MERNVDSRVVWIDMLKGFGMLCVILGHVIGATRPQMLVKCAIYLFHMPLFFMVSGFLFSENKLNIPIKSYIFRIAKRLLTAYVLFGLADFLIYGIRFHFSSEFVWKRLVSLLYGNCLNERSYERPIWFFMVLFVTQSLFFLIRKLKNRKLEMFFFLFLVGVGLFWKRFTSIRLPFRMEIGFVALGFYVIGFEIKKWMQKNEDRPERAAACFALLSALLAGGAIGAYNNYKNAVFIDMSSGRYGTEILFFVSASLISGCFIAFFRRKIRGGGGYIPV